MPSIVRSFVATSMVASFLFAPAPSARADVPPRGNPFACYGAAEGIVRSMSAAQIAREVDKRVSDPPADDESGFDRAVRLCTTAELARRVGDYRAQELYEQAIAAAPDEPGFELWYAYYLRNVRGPRYPLFEGADEHYDRALQKLAALRAAGAEREWDAVTEDWVQRGLVALQQEDGLPLLGRGYPYEAGDSSRTNLSLTLIERASIDTNDFDVNGLDTIDDVRKFTSEMQFASSTQRLARELTPDEKLNLVRTPIRWGSLARLRLRLGAIGAIDVGAMVQRMYEGQIKRFTLPNDFGDVEVNAFAVGYKRAFAVGRAFDLLVEGGYRLIDRKGVVEWEPEQRETIHMAEVHPAIARFIGPDKVTIGSNIVYMAIPPQEFPVTDRERRRLIKAFYGDYAIYRPLLLPTGLTGSLRRMWTRGLHLYGGAAFDDEVYGVRVVHRRDYWGGASLMGVGGFDFTLQLTNFQGYTTFNERLSSGATVDTVDPEQTNAQLRPTFVLLYRLIDEDAIPGMPPTPLAGLNLVIPVRHDVASTGPNTFENTRVGAELWGKLIFRSLRGTTFLVTVGYDAQMFLHLDKVAHMGHLALRMGWGAL